MFQLLQTNKLYIFSFSNGAQTSGTYLATSTQNDVIFHKLKIFVDESRQISVEFIIREKDIYSVMDDISDLMKNSVKSSQ